MTTLIDTVHCLCETFQWVRNTGIIEELLHLTPKAIPDVSAATFVTPLAQIPWG